MSVKERYIRRLLRDAKFYLNNIDGDDPQDPIGDVKKAGTGNHPVDTFVNHSRGAQSLNHEEVKNTENEVSSYYLKFLIID
jgi:hypothetical protein